MRRQHNSNGPATDSARRPNIATRFRVRRILALLTAFTTAVSAAGAGDAPQTAATLFPTEWTIYSATTGLPDNGIRSVLVEHDDTWVGTDNGLARISPDRTASWTTRDGVPWPAVTALDMDSTTQTLWLGTFGGGIARFTAGRFDVFDQLNSGLAGNLIFDILAEGDRVWIATNVGISLFDVFKQRWDLYLPRRAHEPEQVALDLHHDVDGVVASLWLGDPVRFDQSTNTFTRPAWASVIPAGETIQHTRVTPDYAYCVTPWRIIRCHRSTGTIEAITHTVPPAQDKLITCMAVDPTSQHIWLGTRHGLLVLVDWAQQRWIHHACCKTESVWRTEVRTGRRVVASYATDGGIPDNRIRCIAVKDDNVWIGTADGLANGRSWHQLREGIKLTSRMASVHTATPRAKTSQPAVAQQRYKIAGMHEEGAVQVAVLGPTSRTMALPGVRSGDLIPSHRPDLQAIQFAVDAANRAGGYDGEHSFQLVTGIKGYAHYGWVTLEDEFALHARSEEIVAVVGKLRPNAPITSAVAWMAEVPIINVAHHEPTADEQINPWIFRPRDDLMLEARLVAEYLASTLDQHKIVVLRDPAVLGATPLDGLTSWIESGVILSDAVVVDTESPPGNLLTAAAGADAVWTWSSAAWSGRMLASLRQAGIATPFVGSGALRQAAFLESAGEEPGVVYALYNDQTEHGRTATTYAALHQDRLGRPPEPDAYLAYAATGQLLDDITTAGRNRDVLRNHLAAQRAHADDSASDVHAILAELRNGTWQFHIVRGK